MKGFFRLIEKKKWFVFLFFLLLFLPADNFYEQIRRQTKEPLVETQGVDFTEPADYPVNQTEAPAPAITATSVMVIDLASRTILLSKNAGTRLAPASTTKIMTAVVALENYQLEDVFTVPDLIGLEGRQMGLVAGEKMTVRNLLYGLLVHSGNDAAYTLAANYLSGVGEFIYSMNQKARELNLKNTRFTDVSGLDQDNHYTSVYDLVQLTAYALGNPVFKEMVAVKTIVVQDIDQQYEHQLETTNELLDQVLGVKGVKTGWTENAGECLVAYTERNGRELLIVVLGSADRFGETEKLINWVFNNFHWQTIIQSTPN